jgi:hypothetical protein
MRAKALLLASCLGCSSLLAADEAFTFGLRHTLITNAMFSTDIDDPLSVFNTGFTDDGTNYVFGIFGASVHLGAADAGVFVSVNCDRQDGWSLEGTSFGTVNGVTNAPIGSIMGTRNGFGHYDVHMDFSSIGATGYTYQILFHDLKTLEVTNAGPDSVVDAGGLGPPPPRVNPIWINGGRVGVVIDFGNSLSEFNVPGFHAYGSKMIILAENPTNTIEHVSRVDLVGRGGLPLFTIENERLNKFGLYHQALGKVRFNAAAAQLTVSNIDASSLQGIFTELPNVKTFRAALLPCALTNDGSSVSVSANGTSSRTTDFKFLGNVQLTRENNGVSLLSGLGGITNVVTRVLSNGVIVGTAISNDGELGIIPETNVVLNSYAAAATQTNEPAYIGFRFDSPITFNSGAGTTLTGDEIRVSIDSQDEVIGVLTDIALVGQSLDQVTITGIDTLVLPPDPLRIAFAFKDHDLRLSWPFTSDYFLTAKNDLNDPNWLYVNNGTFTYTNFQVQYDLPTNFVSPVFFELRHIYSGYLFSPLPGGGNP